MGSAMFEWFVLGGMVPTITVVGNLNKYCAISFFFVVLFCQYWRILVNSLQDPEVVLTVLYGNKTTLWNVKKNI